jgi:threonine dehydrogenase-like Zn-dependent dehydrogenase
VGRVIVIGAGTIGIGCLQAALMQSADSVTVVERHPRRREQASALGARQVLADLAEVDPGADLVVDAAGSSATRRATIELLGPAGTAAFVGLHSDETPLSWHRVIRSNIRVQGSFGYADRDFQQALDWLAGGRATIPLSRLRPIEDGPAAFATLAAGPIDDIKVFLG